MTAQEYVAMLKAVPTQAGLAAVGHAFLREALDALHNLHSEEEVRAYAAEHQEKWAEICRLSEGVVSPTPNPAAYTALPDMLLARKRF
jgi:hypothetical protein